jgi:hypothetical protein
LELSPLYDLFSKWSKFQLYWNPGNLTLPTSVKVMSAIHTFQG